MNTRQTEEASLCISQERLLGLVRAMTGESTGREDDEHPSPPGPWDPVIRVGLEQLRFIGPRHELSSSVGPERTHSRSADASGNPRFDPRNVIFQTIFRKHPGMYEVIGGGHSFGDEVALNPQPLPPREAFLIAAARAVIRRAELLQEIAGAIFDEGSERGIIIVSGYTSRFSDDWCGTEFRLRWPLPGPRPNWFAHELDGIDLLVVATQFEQAAKEAYSRELRNHLIKVGEKFTEAGMSRLQSVMDQSGYAREC
jgi:hypothetical protein